MDASGLVLAPYPGPGGAVHTRATIIVQLATFGALHRMLKGAYNSGIVYCIWQRFSVMCVSIKVQIML